MRQIWLLHSRRFIFKIIASPTAAIWKISSNEKMSYIQETTLTTKILPKVLHKCFGSTTRSIHSISVEHQSKYRMDVKRREKVWRKCILRRTWSNQITSYMLALSDLHFFDLAKGWVFLKGLHIELLNKNLTHFTLINIINIIINFNFNLVLLKSVVDYP